jgi:hypothetical protein
MDGSDELDLFLFRIGDLLLNLSIFVLDGTVVFFFFFLEGPEGFGFIFLTQRSDIDVKSN